MTLHEAMAHVLREHGGWMHRDELAREIARRDLYRQRSGEHAPSDQLRLRARKYPHLFEGSERAYTQIRLRAGAVETRSSDRGHRPSPRAPSAPAAAAAPSRDAEAARRRRAQAARKYKPREVKLLLVAEAPPSALDRYFYFEAVSRQDSLFRYVARMLLGVEPTRDNKPELLARLRDEGVFLVDLSVDPLDATPLDRFLPDLVKRATALAPDKVILIKATVYDLAFAALREAGLPVVDERIPFPGSGQQKRFEAAFARALER